MGKLKIGLDKIVVGFSELALNDHLKESSEKLGILGEAVAEFQRLCNTDVSDMAEFENSFYEYTLSYIKTKHKSGLALGLHTDQFLNLYGYNLGKLKDIEARYIIQRGSLICSNNLFKINESLDFNVYSETEIELQKFRDVQELIKSITKIHERYFKEQRPIQAMQFMNVLYCFNSDATEIIPNKYFIKQ